MDARPVKVIKDPVHGYITIEERYVNNVIDTEYFQRLRNIRQLDTTRYVYPSAAHSRFEHTLGVFHLGSTAFESLNTEFDIPDNKLKEMKRTFKCALLFHDIGHFPFSHLGELCADTESVREKLVQDYELEQKLEEANVESILDDADAHEMMGCIIVLEEYFDWLENEEEVNPYEICAHVLGTSIKRRDNWEWEVLSDLLNSHIDVDRLDYMIRDDFMSGASMVSVDSERLVKAYTTSDQSLAISDKAHSTIGNFLDGRNAVYMWITQHHKVVYSSRLLEEMIREYLNSRNNNNDEITADEILERKLDDIDIISRIREIARSDEASYMSDLYDRFVSRNYLASCWKHMIEFDDKITDPVQERLKAKINHKRTDVENYFKNELGLEDDEIMCDPSKVPGYESQELQEIFVQKGDEAERISKHDIYTKRSELFKPIPYIFAPEEYVEQVLEELEDPEWLVSL